MNAADRSPILQIAASFTSGKGLVEVVALATLIGSSTAAELVLGNRGAAGLVWGSITAFGCSSVIKACASAASPGWLRQMLGLRTELSDKAFGMELPLEPSSRVAGRIRGMLENPLGVSCDRKPQGRSSELREAYNDIYAFDSTTSTMLSEISSTSPDSPLRVHTHYPYATYSGHDLYFQIFVLLLSLLKIFEIYTLFLLQNDEILLTVLSGTSFLASLLSGICLEINNIIASRRPIEMDGHVDMVVATPLPTTKHPGGQRKVILGTSNATRTGPWWRLFWLLTGSLQLSSAIMTYFLLGRQSTTFVLTWTGFQISWLALRMLIFELDLTDASRVPPLPARPMKEISLAALPFETKLRVTNLVMASGRYQTHVHPRKLDAYLDDSFNTSQLVRLLRPGNISHDYPLARISGIQEKTVLSSHNAGATVNINIIAVIGDTALSSAAWMLGDPKYAYAPMDVYDSCIVVFELSTLPDNQDKNNPAQAHGSRSVLAVPSARVFSARSPADIAAHQVNYEPLFIPRGAGAQDSAEEKEWIYWIPCSMGKWMQIRSPRSHSSTSKVGSVLGLQTAEVLDDEGVSRVLRAGNLNISLGAAEEVKEIINLSRRASGALYAFLH